jgi:hypothetical protein
MDHININKNLTKIIRFYLLPTTDEIKILKSICLDDLELSIQNIDFIKNNKI